jgi:hypothetical protein
VCSCCCCCCCCRASISRAFCGRCRSNLSSERQVFPWRPIVESSSSSTARVGTGPAESSSTATLSLLFAARSSRAPMDTIPPTPSLCRPLPKFTCNFMKSATVN